LSRGSLALDELFPDCWKNLSPPAPTFSSPETFPVADVAARGGSNEARNTLRMYSGVRETTMELRWTVLARRPTGCEELRNV
jgi:hypothetical protein